MVGKALSPGIPSSGNAVHLTDRMWGEPSLGGTRELVSQNDFGGHPVSRLPNVPVSSAKSADSDRQATNLRHLENSKDLSQKDVEVVGEIDLPNGRNHLTGTYLS